MSDARAEESPALYPVLRGVGGLILRIFYRAISVRCEAPPPESGAVVFAANHPNTLMDPLCVAQVTKRPLHFLGKSGLFKRRFANWFLRSMGVIPVYRRQDDPANWQGQLAGMDQNQQMFAACHAVLGAGGAIALFPEGTSHDDPQLKPLKTGAARISLEAEQLHGGRLGVHIVPIGITFPHRTRFRSTLSIRVGSPIEVAPYLERYAAEPEETFRALTAEVEERIRLLMIHMDRLDLAENVKRVEEIFQDELKSEMDPSLPAAGDTVVLSRSIADAAERLSEQDPEGMSAFWERVDDYVERLRLLRVRDKALRRGLGRLRWLASIAGGFLYGVLALPIAIYGLANHYVPYMLAGAFARRGAEGPEDIAPYKVYFGLPLFLLAYGVQGYFVWRWEGGVVAATYLATLPFVGLWSLAFFRRAAAWWAGVRLGWLSFARPATIARLRAERESLKRELDALKERYLAMPSGGNRGAGI